MKKSRLRAVGCALFSVFVGLSAHAGPGVDSPEPMPVALAVPDKAQHQATLDRLDNALTSISAQRDVSAFGFPCKLRHETRSLPGAMIEVALSAPCRPGERVGLSLGDLRFDMTLPLTGELVITIPALSRETTMTATFETGEALSATTGHEDLPEFARVALQSDLPGQMQLHATSSRRFPVARYKLGDGTGATLDVLSHHLDPDGQSGAIRLSLLSLVQHELCDKDRTGQITELRPDGTSKRYAVQLAAPGCDRVGEILELKNIVQDLKLPSG